MQLLINHLTRMHGGHICLAGVDLQTREHVRPVLANDPLPFYLLARYGGPFEMAWIIDMGAPRHTPVPPHVEDHVFVPAHVRVHRPAAAHEFWSLLEQLASASLREIFGESLQEVGRGRWGTPPGQGLVSLGLLRPERRSELYLAAGRDRKPPQIRMRFGAGRIQVDASVTDLRLFGDDHATAQPACIHAINQWIADSQNVILSVGLTRNFRSDDHRDGRHWLQVNNIHLKENPTWSLG